MKILHLKSLTKTEFFFRNVQSKAIVVTTKDGKHIIFITLEETLNEFITAKKYSNGHTSKNSFVSNLIKVN